MISSGAQPPKKRKIQAIFLGAINGSSEIRSHSPVHLAHLPLPSDVPSTSAPFRALSTCQRPASISSFSPAGNEPSTNGNKIAIRDCGRQLSLAAKTEPKQNGREGNAAKHLLGTIQNGTCGGIDKNGPAKTKFNVDEFMRPKSRLKLLPQFTNFLSDGKTPRLAVPTAKNELECWIQKETSEGQIDRIVVQNLLDNDCSERKATIQAKFGRESKWMHSAASHLLLVQANRYWTVSFFEDMSLIIFRTQTGQAHFSFRAQSPVALLELCDNFCVLVSAEAEAQIWDLAQSRSLLRTSTRPLFCGQPFAGIVRAFITDAGVPMVVGSNGDAYVCSPALQSWHHLSIGPDFIIAHLCSMQMVAKIMPDGIVAALLEISKIEKSPFVIPQRDEIAAANEERQLETLLKMMFELASWEEYRYFATIYIQKLLLRGKRAKLVEFLEEFGALLRSDTFPIRLTTVMDALRPLNAIANGIDIEGTLLRQNRGEKQLEEGRGNGREGAG